MSYPIKPDGRGSARVNFNGRAYYFGEHNTPASFELFVEWKKRVVEADGEPVDTQLGRYPLAHKRCEQSSDGLADEDQEVHWTRQNWIGLACACALAGIFVGAIFSNLFSIPRRPVVDGIPMTADETDFIRKMRAEAENFARIQAENKDRVASLTKKLMEEGIGSAALHKRGPGQ
ncbi:MAG: hypothetical protein MI861_10295 [Pirellulales bacterium]|nr:hypothetical protein [Pirellulales bacterium]